MDKPEFERIELTVPKGLLGVLDLFAERKGLAGGRDEMIKGLLISYGASCARDLHAEDNGEPLPDTTSWSTLTVGIPKSAIAILERSAAELNTEASDLVSQCLQEWTKAQREWHKTLDASDRAEKVH